MFSFNIIFWNSSDVQLLENTKMCIFKAIQFVKFLNKNNLNSILNVFDFSEKQVLENSIHIPYPSNEFRKSEKINNIIKYNFEKINPTIFSIIDSDVVILQEEYIDLANSLIELYNNENIFYTCFLSDIRNRSCIDFKNNKIDIKKAEIELRSVDYLGAFFSIHFKELCKIGGFDERFVDYGGEDCDASDRLKRNGLKSKQLGATFYHLPHISLENKEVYNPQFNIVTDDLSIFRYGKILPNELFINKKNDFH